MWAVFSGYERAVSDCLVSDCLWTVLERFRIRFMASGKRKFVPRVQAFPYLSLTVKGYPTLLFEKYLFRRRFEI